MINPTNNERGKISKKIIEQINQEILKKTDVNLWKNTNNVLDWFNNIQNKKKTVPTNKPRGLHVETT